MLNNNIPPPMSGTYKTSMSKMNGRSNYNPQKLGTVESRHQEQLVKFSQLEKDLPQKKRHLKTLQKKLVKVDDAKEQKLLERETADLKEEIRKIGTGELKDHYLIDTGLILMKYYDHLENPLSEPTTKKEDRTRKKQVNKTSSLRNHLSNQKSVRTIGPQQPKLARGASELVQTSINIKQTNSFGLGCAPKTNRQKKVRGIKNEFSNKQDWVIPNSRSVVQGGQPRSTSLTKKQVQTDQISTLIPKTVMSSTGKTNYPVKDRARYCSIESGEGETTPSDTNKFKIKKKDQLSILTPISKNNFRTKSGISDYFNTGNSNNKESRFELLDQYLSKIDSNWVPKSQPTQIESENICECGALRRQIQTESKLVCEECGIEHITQTDTDRISYKDPPPEMNYFAYRRINHFNELLVQFQAKESTNIPKEVYNMILLELKKEWKTVKDLNYALVKRYLKKYARKGYNAYYDHIFYIIYRLNGEKPLTMTPEMEETLRSLFLRIQEPFEKYCPPGRKNFISYNFVFYKFCEMLGYNEFLKYFSLLKSKDKRYEQEKIWEKIVADVGLV